MDSSDKPIIDYIPRFLEYSRKEKNLLPKSIENYKRFLNLFIIWLKESNSSNLSPQKLSPRHIQEYKYFLSKKISPETQRPITQKTQNLYLIALRLLLSYLIEKDIPSLLPNKIKLFKEEKTQSKNKLLNLKQLEKLLQAPDTSRVTGLRDRVILEVLFSTGLKVAQLTALNRDQIKIEPDTRNLEIRILDKENNYQRSVYLSERAMNWLKKYLKTRLDQDKALFINYRSRKTPSRRLTTRSIERTVKKYIRKAGLLSQLTPETLRNAYTLTILNNEDKIKINHAPLSHKKITIKNYKFISDKKSSVFPSQNINLPKTPQWHIIERVISKEINWLKNNIPVLPESYKKSPSLLNCDDCLLRKIAILVVSGKIKAIELERKNSRKDLWNNLTTKENLQKISRHGEYWHSKMMDVILNYFKDRGNKVISEPILNYGRADLGVVIRPNRVLYIEVDTVSLFKLWYNLSIMKNATFLIIPSEKYAIEFKVL